MPDPIATVQNFIDGAMMACAVGAMVGDDSIPTKSEIPEKYRELLLAAYGDGRLWIDHSEMHGVFVRTASRAFCNDGDYKIAARYAGVFSRMCRKGYLHHSGGNVFRLSPLGVEVIEARLL